MAAVVGQVWVGGGRCACGVAQRKKTALPGWRKMLGLVGGYWQQRIMTGRRPLRGSDFFLYKSSRHLGVVHIISKICDAHSTAKQPISAEGDPLRAACAPACAQGRGGGRGHPACRAQGRPAGSCRRCRACCRCWACCRCLACRHSAGAPLPQQWRLPCPAPPAPRPSPRRTECAPTGVAARAARPRSGLGLHHSECTNVGAGPRPASRSCQRRSGGSGSAQARAGGPRGPLRRQSACRTQRHERRFGQRDGPAGGRQEHARPSQGQRVTRCTETGHLHINVRQGGVGRQSRASQ